MHLVTRKVVHADHDDTAHVRHHCLGMLPCVAVSAQVVHLAGKTPRQPVLQVGEAIGVRGRRDARELEPQLTGALQKALLQARLLHNDGHGESPGADVPAE
jgi:hypothetical protein